MHNEQSPANNETEQSGLLSNGMSNGCQHACYLTRAQISRY